MILHTFGQIDIRPGDAGVRLEGEMGVNKVSHFNPLCYQGIIHLNLVVNRALLKAHFHGGRTRNETADSTCEKQKKFLHIFSFNLRA